MERMLIICTLFILVFSSCNNEIDLFEEPKDIPVVYGLISSSAGSQYIRIEKGFLNKTIGADKLAKDANNLYYDKVEASIRNSRTEKVFELEKVNAEDLGYQRQDGFFAKSPNFVYRFIVEEGDMKEGDELFFSAILGDEDAEPVTAKVQILSPTVVTSPSVQYKVGIDPTKTFDVVWYYLKESVNPPTLWDVDFIIHYREADLTQPEPEWVNKSLVWGVLNNVSKSSSQSNSSKHEVEGISFYTFLNGALEQNPSLIRQLVSLDVRILSSDKELSRYIEVQQANTGVTSSQPSPLYSNISRGHGLIGARETSVFKGLFFSEKTKEFVKTNDFTKDLGFK